MTVEELQIIISAKMDDAYKKLKVLKGNLDNLTADKKTSNIYVTTDKAQNNMRKLQSEVDRTRAKIDKLNQKMQQIYAQRDFAADKYTDIPSLSGMTRDQSIDYMVSNDPKIKQYDAQLAQLEAQMSPLKAKLSDLGSTANTVSQKTNTLSNTTESAAKKTKKLGKSAKTAGNYMRSGGRGAGYFGRMIKSMLVSMTLYSGISLLIRSISEGLQNIAQSSNAANGTLSRLSESFLQVKNSVAAAFLPVLQAVEPVLINFMTRIADCFMWIGMLTSKIFGGANTFLRARSATVNYAESLAKATKATKKYKSEDAKPKKGSLASFDQINTLNKYNKSNSINTVNPESGIKIGKPNPKEMFEKVPIPNWIDTIAKKIKATLAYIKAIISGAILVIGTLLLLSGANIPLGIGLMLAGAVGLATTISANWGYMDNQLRGVLTVITAALGGFFLVLGAILTFTGVNIPLGIGLMLLGAGSLAAAVAINWGKIKTDMSGVLVGITGVVSGAALALGALFTLTGVDVPLGIGLMLLGAVGIASMVALNWGSMGKQTKSTVSMITTIVGGALLAVGAILAFSGAAPALGIPMMIVGASVLATTIALNWGHMSKQLKTTITLITTIIGTAFLALGAILTFTGANIPLGIGLILAGAGSLAAAFSINWEAVKNKVRCVLADILAIASTASLALGVILCLTGAGIPLGVGLILAGIGGIAKAHSISSNPITRWARDLANGVINIFETSVNWIIHMLNKVSFTVPDWVLGIGGKTYGINLSPVSIPRLATGGVVRGATPLIAGEDGAEAIVPLEHNTGWITAVATETARQLSKQDVSSSDDGWMDTLARKIVACQQAATTANGGSSISMQATMVLDSGEVMGAYHTRTNLASRYGSDY